MFKLIILLTLTNGDGQITIHQFKTLAACHRAQVRVMMEIDKPVVAHAFCKEEAQNDY